MFIGFIQLPIGLIAIEEDGGLIALKEVDTHLTVGPSTRLSKTFFLVMGTKDKHIAKRSHQ